MTRHRFALRTRLTLLFGIGALALSSSLASITYYTTRHTVLAQAITADEQTAYSNSRVVSQDLAPDESPNRIQVSSNLVGDLASIDDVAHSVSLVGFTPSIGVGDVTRITETNIPLGLRNLVLGVGHRPATPGEQIFRINDVNYIAVGIPISLVSGHAAYFELFDLSQITSTLKIVLGALVLAAIITTIAGAILGRWAARRTLAPLRNAARAALDIANGRLETRLEANDESDLAVLASSFNTMVDRLQERIERDARFTSDVSHELRSPLTTLAASLAVMEARRDELPPRALQAFDLLASETRRFQRMVGDLLEISRIDAGASDFDPSTVRVGELLRRALRHLDSSEIPLVIDETFEQRELTVDKRRFERIIANLIENANRYGDGVVRIVVDEHNQMLRIAIDDAGPGVPFSERERIFERFARGSAVAGRRGAGEGTGLGLSLVYEHVKLHAGRVFVENRYPLGARFVVELPLAPPQDTDDEAVVDDEEQDGAEQDDGANAIPAAEAPSTSPTRSNR